MAIGTEENRQIEPIQQDDETVDGEGPLRWNEYPLGSPERRQKYEEEMENRRQAAIARANEAAKEFPGLNKLPENAKWGEINKHATKLRRRRKEVELGRPIKTEEELLKIEAAEYAEKYNNRSNGHKS